ncbi:TetR/AcrR family transcriptional regulator [Nocardioides jiangxiensis]|uniref:TetR/AcrR family transcriptional regulator n=1 Tax=Nocardioides jiangxiensis TaxID=3064524 RepID=A0ABT9B3S3_9ACTN|nr:TetR/AcrR family transcriptional regulator [Nocardioides sp. WY-20]MDO7868247.1 TetR/AcrR family transcriptional regulator [Nocardioides sp. WY-20]
MLEVAWELLIERGLADLTLAELGRRVETSAGHLLYYFGSKDGLLLEVLRWSEAQLWARWEESRAEEATFAERFDLFCRQFMPSGLGDPRWLVWIEVWPRVLRIEELREPYEELDAVWRDELTRLLGEAGAENAAALSRRICALLDGLSVAIVLGEDDVSVDAAVDHARALLPADLAVAAH